MRSLLVSFSIASLVSGLAMAQQKPVTIKPGASPAAAKKSGFDKTAVGEYVKNVEMWPKEVELNISDPKPSAYLPGFQEFTVGAIYQGKEVIQRQYYLSADGQRFIQGNVFMLDKHPFQRNMDKLRTDLMPSFGTPGAPVTLVVFSDFECPYCREEAKALREKLPQEFPTDVRVYYKEFPLQMIHPWAMKSAIAGRCVFRANPEAFWDYHDWIFDKQTDMTPENVDSKILEWAGTKGLDTLQLTRCMETSATEPEVRKNMAEGLSLGVDRTPTLFLNGRPLEGMTWEQLKARIAFELGYQKTAKNAGEKCCEVTIPGAVK
jgi:protein-disulfide isomerase